MVCFAITGTYGATPTKHSRMNAESTGEFVVNVVTRELLEEMPPFLVGGDMISVVTKESTTWAPVPTKFEAGTPPIIEAAGLRQQPIQVRRPGAQRGALLRPAALETAGELARRVRAGAGGGFVVLGPAVAPMAKSMACPLPSRCSR